MIRHAIVLVSEYSTYKFRLESLSRADVLAFSASVGVAII